MPTACKNRLSALGVKQIMTKDVLEDVVENLTTDVLRGGTVFFLKNIKPRKVKFPIR